METPTERSKGVAKDDDSESERPPRQQMAVAIAYAPDQGDEAPRVTASGRGKTAERILDLAFTNGVRVREDRDLTQLLSTVEVDSVVPLEALMAVAEILAYVYRANGLAEAGPL